MYNLFYHLAELIGRHFCHFATSTCGLHTCCIFFHAENAYFSIWATESLETFKSFLSIMETYSRHMKRDIFIRTYLNLTPLSIVIVATNVVVRLHVTKFQVRPVDLFHNNSNFVRFYRAKILFF